MATLFDKLALASVIATAAVFPAFGATPCEVWGSLEPCAKQQPWYAPIMHPAPAVKPPIQGGAAPATDAAVGDRSGGATDPALGSNIADIAEFYRSYVPSHFIPSVLASDYRVLVNDPEAKKLETKFIVAKGFFGRGSYGDGSGNWIDNDAKFNDLATACRWFRLTLGQLKSEYPSIDIGNNGFGHDPARIDPSGKLLNIIYNAGNSMVFACHTKAERAQAHAQAACSSKDLHDNGPRPNPASSLNRQVSDTYRALLVSQTIQKINSKIAQNVLGLFGDVGLDPNSCKNVKEEQNSINSVTVSVNEINKLGDGEYRAIVTSHIDGKAETQKIGFIRGDDGLTLTCIDDACH